jgi:hypothetical protein
VDPNPSNKLGCSEIQVTSAAAKPKIGMQRSQPGQRKMQGR